MENRCNALNWWPAPAKLNLFLHVTGRRSDGYHELSTAFQFLEFSDRLAFLPRDDSELHLVEPTPGVAAGEDLVLRAAHALRQAMGRSPGVDIRLEKRIPMGRGLGGGSSDAATTLVALDALWKGQQGIDRLAQIGLDLGADVPVFVRGRAAFASGIGEVLIPAEFPEYWYIVLDPGVAIGTRELFAAPELKRDSAKVSTTDFCLDDARNDCEPVVRRRYPEVARALDWLAEHGPARLTGTGSCVYSWRETRSDAECLVASVPAPWQAIVARGRNRSPLADRLEASS